MVEAVEAGACEGYDVSIFENVFRMSLKMVRMSELLALVAANADDGARRASESDANKRITIVSDAPARRNICI